MGLLSPWPYLLLLTACANTPEPGSLEYLKQKAISEAAWTCYHKNMERFPGVETVFPDVPPQVMRDCARWARKAYGK